MVINLVPQQNDRGVRGRSMSTSQSPTEPAEPAVFSQQTVPTQPVHPIGRWCFNLKAPQIGELYDANQDRPLNEMPFKSNFLIEPLISTEDLSGFKAYVEPSLKSIFKVDHDQKISIITELCELNGIGHLFSKGSNDGSMDLIFYVQVKKQVLGSLDELYRKGAWKSQLPRSATHLVLQVTHGAIGVLRLSFKDGSKDQSALEKELRRIHDNLIKSYTPHPPPNNMQLQFYHTDNMTAVPKTNFTDVVKILLEIKTLQNEAPRCRPIHFHLVPLSSLKAYFQGDIYKFYPLSDENYRKVVERFKAIKKLGISKPLNPQTDEVEKEKGKYSGEVESALTSLRHQIIALRSKNQKSFDDPLKGRYDKMRHTEEGTLNTSIDAQITPIETNTSGTSQKFARETSSSTSNQKIPSTTVQPQTETKKVAMKLSDAENSEKKSTNIQTESWQVALEPKASTTVEPFDTEVNSLKFLKSEKTGTSKTRDERSRKIEDDDTCQNILLLGETGVGKSTFINSLINFLTYQSYDQALTQKEPLHLIPSRFSVKKSANDEHEVTVGKLTEEDIESSDNGKSVTKRPHSYLLKTSTRKVRIIDTPGIGDTDGPMRDAENFQKVLDFIGNFKAIHGICILLRPNNARVTLTFRYCINELLANLNVSAVHNIIFCFTNARATFYRPGDSLPMLKTFLEDLKMKHKIEIPAIKKTIYCFDSEAFLYLTARKLGVSVEEQVMQQCHTSWDRSQAEVTRLFEHISALSPHLIQDSVTLNSARRMVLALCEPFAEISTQIQQNVKYLNASRDEIASLDENKIKIKDHLYKKRFITKVFPLEVPYYKCKNLYCKNKQTKKNSSRNSNQCEFNPSSKYTGTYYLKCLSCFCYYSSHSLVSERSYQLEEQYVDENLAHELKNNDTQRNNKQIILHSIESGIRSGESELKAILEAAAEFTAFLRARAMVAVNDAVEASLHHAIQEELLLINMNCGSVEKMRTYEKNLADYRLQKEMLSKTDSCSPTKEVLSPGEVMEKISKLFALQGVGSQIKLLFDAEMRDQEGSLFAQEIVYESSS